YGRLRIAERTKRRSRTPFRGPRPSIMQETAQPSRLAHRLTARTQERLLTTSSGTSFCKDDEDEQRAPQQAVLAYKELTKVPATSGTSFLGLPFSNSHSQ